MPDTPAGQAPPGDDELCAIGAIVRPRGIHGELKTDILCHDAQHFLQCARSAPLYLFRPPAHPQGPNPAVPRPEAVPLWPDGAGPWRVEIEGLRLHAGQALLRVADIADRDQAEALRGLLLGLPRARLPQPQAGEYYHFELEGLEVRDAHNDALLGHVRAVLDNPAHPLLEIQTPDSGAVFLLPFIKQFVLHEDLVAGRLLVQLPPGLLESQS